MKAVQVAFISIVGNLVLGVAVVVLVKAPPPHVVVLETNAPVQVVERRVDVPQGMDWKKVESEDYRQYILNLRSIGCPEQTVRDIIIADVNALFDARREAAMKETEEFKFWKSGQLHLFGTAQARRLQRQFEELRQLAEEKRAILRELLGIEVAERPSAALATLNPREQMLAFLPAEKRLKLEELERRYSARLMQKSVDASGSEQLANYRQMQADKRAEVQALLSPEEFEEYEMRVSPAAVAVRTGLGALNLSAEEFRAMVALRKEYDDEVGDLLSHDPSDAGARERKSAAQKRLETRIQELVGVERWSAHQREKDLSLRGAAIGSGGAGVPEALTVHVQEIKAIALGELQRLEADPELAAEARQSTMAEIEMAVEEALVHVLGRGGYESYSAQPGAVWLRKLKLAGRGGPVGKP